MKNWAFFLISFALGVNCLGATMTKYAPVDIQLGEVGTIFADRNSGQLEFDPQPAGLNFYKIRFPTGKRGAVNLNCSGRKFLIENVISVLGTEDTDFKEEGLSEFSINSAITDSDLVSHDEARVKFFALLQRIVDSGWKTFIPLSAPRLRGKEMTQYRLTTRNRATLDPSYVPSFDEWMRMKSLTGWKFYANHAYLKVTFTREHTLTDPTRPGAYLISFELKNEAEEFRGQVGGSERNRWKELLPTKLKELAQERLKKETELRMKGAKIDETYMDPPMPDISRK